MKYSLFFVLIFYIVCPLEATIGPGGRRSTTYTPATVDFSESSSAEEKPTTSLRSTRENPLPPTDTNVLQRDLIQEDISPRTILENHLSYCDSCSDIRQFYNPTLIYITPWNNHGYDLAKIFTKKFDYVSPVWFRIKRQGYQMYVVEGKQDIDSLWIETLKTKNSDVRIVPRVSFEHWSATDLHALFESEDEKQHLASTLKDLLVDNTHLFDGFVLEILSQFHGASKATTHHLLSDIAEHIHAIEKTAYRKEVILAVPPLEEYFDRNDFNVLSKHLDGFHVMTYDFPTKEPGPVSPFPWIKEVMRKFPKTRSDSSVKLFLGINFYGYRFDYIIPPPPKDRPQYHMKHIIGRDYIDFLKQYYPTAKIHFDARAHEHVTVVYTRSEVNVNRQAHYLPQIVIFYPSLKSIHDRLQLAMELNIGVAIWDGGQGFDYFFDLF
ncbi:unnamed protein product [Adineta ricciae]|uniref:Chitinase domain-containing protein 1 n=1 Tax=Adineta ricciae TaxID=249248 RepID=A0A814SJX6_ADIRI|nr:unnamed protein product [Adineta ricciae]CAF1148577.1 unnamed protein product [Adineta ricciae]